VNVYKGKPSVISEFFLSTFLAVAPVLTFGHGEAQPSHPAGLVRGLSGSLAWLPAWQVGAGGFFPLLMATKNWMSPGGGH
jgi:hypothetical protein